MESVASVYIAGEFARICFSLQWCSHTFLGEKPEDASRGEPAQVPSSPPLEGLFGARARDAVFRTWSQVALGDGHGAGECGGAARALVGPGVGGWRGQPCVG